MNNEQLLTGIIRRDWSFDRRGEQEEARHNEKVKESIRDNLGNIISDGSIITADPKSKKTIKIPMRSIELPRFKYGNPEDGVGTGDGPVSPGDIVGHRPAPGEGDGAGDQPGQEYYEAELTLEEIQDLVFDDLGLPNIKPKQTKQMESEQLRYDDIRKKKTTNNLDLSRTIMEHMRRQAVETGRVAIGEISPDDLRVRTWETEKKPENNAVVIAMADISGSMGEFEKYITRAFCWWTVNFLRTKYPNVEIVFIAHDTEAYEVTEEQFFTRGMGGGTKCSSANQKALDIINERFPTTGYNVYPLHFSDGDNWFDDNDKCVDLVQELLDKDVNQYAYIQIGGRSQSNLLNDYRNHISDERFNGVVIEEKGDVLNALKQVFDASKSGSEGL